MYTTLLLLLQVQVQNTPSGRPAVGVIAPGTTVDVAPNGATAVTTPVGINVLTSPDGGTMVTGIPVVGTVVAGHHRKLLSF
jgi:hypothetical protein